MELFRLIGKLAIEGVDEAKNKLDGVTNTAEKSQGKMVSAFKKIGAAVGAAFAVKQIADFGVKITELSVQAYADYEQLTGGIDTLFKDSYDKVMEYANNAYKTSGMSANEYMETVTSFSASLLQSLGGDTEAAADAANLAITDMADNVNKMGTSMESIQNAYQGFAKQNYTMLDNLKLGYGGTKEEMQRLLDKANELNKEQGIYTDYQISSYADIVEAIHVVQKEIGITGATADEAATTISGSTAAMKAAWQNLLVGFAAGDQDMEVLINNFATSLTTVAKNVVPRVIQTFKSVGSVLVNNIIGGFVDNTPQILEQGRETLVNFALGITNALPDLIDKATEVIRNLIAYLKENMPHFMAIGAEFIYTLSTGLIKSIPHLLEGAFEIITDLADYFITFDWLEVGKGIIRGIGNGIAGMADWVVDQAKQVGSRIVESLNGMFGGMFSNQSASKASVTATVGGKVRANAEGGILTKPTIFGYTPATNTYQLGGEAGAEAIAPISTLQKYVEESVAKVISQQTAILQSILNAIVQQGTNQEMTAIVQLDGKTVAKSVFKPLQDITKQHGKSLVTT